MRIAMLAWEARYGVAVGGVSVHVSDLAEALARAGHQVSVFTRMGAGMRLHDQIRGVLYTRVPYQRHESLVAEVERFGAGVARYLREQESRDGPFDVVHAHDFLAAPALLTLAGAPGAGAGASAGGRGRLLVTTFHTTELDRSDGRWPEAGEAVACADLERRAIAASHAIVPVSQAVRRNLEMLYHPPDHKTRVIYYGVDTHAFDGAGSTENARLELGLDSRDRILLFVGRLTPAKGADLLLAALEPLMRQHPTVKALFVGEGAQAENLAREAEALGVSRACHFLGARVGGSLAGLYRAAEVVVMPFRHDPFGMVALSAWAAQRPVVVGGGGAATEFVYHDVSGLVTSLDPAALADAAAMLLSDRDHAAWLGRNGRVAVETAFSWDAIARQVLSLYADARRRHGDAG